jgi:hypothetical protein
MNNYSYISTEQNQLQNRQLLSPPLFLYFPCLGISQIHDLQSKDDTFAIIIMEAVITCHYFCLFLSSLPNFNYSKKGGKNGSEAGLKKISLSGEQKEIPAPPTVSAFDHAKALDRNLQD